MIGVDDEPVFQFDASGNMTSTDSDVFYINGTLVSGSECLLKELFPWTS